MLDPDPVSGQQVAMTLDAAGLDPQACAFEARALIDALRGFNPQLLWVRAELGSDTLGRLLATLERQAQFATLPIVLLCQDVREAAYVRQMKTGVVELLQLPFSPRLHLARLRLLPRELPERRGQLRGSGTGRDLQSLLEHLIRAHRTGTLSVNEGASNEGRAFFVKGVLQSAWFGKQQGPTALASLGALPEAQWQFSEGADGAGGLFEWDALSGEADEPLELQLAGASPQVAPGPAAAPPPPAALEPPRPTAPPPTGYANLAAGSAGVPATAPTVEAASDVSQTAVLFVDDDPALSKLFQTYFSKKGYPVDTAADGVEAMQKLLERPFEIVIADLNMPRLDGWGLLRVLREDARTQETPVALFSCHDDYRESLRAMHAGAQAYYPKSLRMNALELQVRELLEPRRRFERLASGGQSVTQNLSALGAQWVLKLLSKLKVTGRLDATDAWATFRLYFTSGVLTQAVARVENQTLDPTQALTAFITGRGIEGSLAFGGESLPSAFGGQSTEDLLAYMAEHLNEMKRRSREEAQAGAKALEVDAELYQLYASVGPPQYRAIAQLLCEVKLLPRDVMARLGATPQEVATVVNDLLLRGVATLRA
ncbi:MAG: response regulator [Archangiaceae bacterium]|nr:response regulator [Archangiaceae bacterium]